VKMTGCTGRPCSPLRIDLAMQVTPLRKQHTHAGAMAAMLCSDACAAHVRTHPAYTQRQRHQQQQTSLLLRLLLPLSSTAAAAGRLACSLLLTSGTSCAAAVVSWQQLLQSAAHHSTIDICLQLITEAPCAPVQKYAGGFPRTALAATNLRQIILQQKCWLWACTPHLLSWSAGAPPPGSQATCTCKPSGRCCCCSCCCW
jgi:hypothetical protein